MRVLLVQRTMSPPGGGNAVAAWMLQALVGVADLATLTERSWRAEKLDRFFGTNLASASVNQIVAGRSIRSLPRRLDRLRMSLLCRAATRLAHRFDVLVTADNYAPFPRRGLQYLHYPAAITPPRSSLAARAYFSACDAVARRQWSVARNNVTLANSQWTARGLGTHDVSATVLYPPVADAGDGLRWSQRSNTFLCIGRFNGSKRFEIVIDIIARVRSFMSDARLRIIGSNVDHEYTRRLRALQRRHAWISIEEDLSQQDLFDAMRRSRYGIHAMDGEHFGMSVAEMARAGCIVFVHDSGGQVEVINQQPALRWSTPDDAVARIHAIADDPTRQAMLSAQLRAYAARFASERFIQEFRAHVQSFTAMPSS